MMVDREVMWHRLADGPGLERARLERRPDGTILSGIVLAAEGGLPLCVEYRVTCDRDWRTVAVEASQSYAGERRVLRLAHAGNGTWTLDGRPAPSLDGCVDVDLGVSPITNALPVNRLGLAQGETGAVRAAWVRFPALDVGPAEQSYERLGERRYRYRSRSSGFVADIVVDADGLPVDYGDLWRRVAEGPAAAPGPD